VSVSIDDHFGMIFFVSKFDDAATVRTLGPVIMFVMNRGSLFEIARLLVVRFAVRASDAAEK
jgi:hypothetical protein